MRIFSKFSTNAAKGIPKTNTSKPNYWQLNKRVNKYKIVNRLWFFLYIISLSRVELHSIVFYPSIFWWVFTVLIIFLTPLNFINETIDPLLSTCRHALFIWNVSYHVVCWFVSTTFFYRLSISVKGGELTRSEISKLFAKGPHKLLHNNSMTGHLT